MASLSSSSTSSDKAVNSAVKNMSASDDPMIGIDSSQVIPTTQIDDPAQPVAAAKPLFLGPVTDRRR